MNIVALIVTHDLTVWSSTSMPTMRWPARAAAVPDLDAWSRYLRLSIRVARALRIYQRQALVDVDVGAHAPAAAT